MAIVRERTMYNVTTEEKGLKSLENGLNWRLTKQSKFGHGVSFSNNADYADFYANSEKQSGEVKRVIIVCAVLVARTCVTDPFSNCKIPTGMVDTTISPEKLVYVKYNDYEFYPLYMVYYRCTLTDPWINRHNSKNNTQRPKPQVQQINKQIYKLPKQFNNMNNFTFTSSKNVVINFYNYS